MRRLAFLAPAVFVAHAAEEFLTGFPEWATRHFGTTSRRFYLASHAVLISSIVATSVLASRQRPGHKAQLLLGAMAAGFVANGIFHVETTVRFGERSPGLVTGVALMIPGGLAILDELLDAQGMDAFELSKLVAAGLALNAAAVASLRLDMPRLVTDD